MRNLRTAGVATSRLELGPAQEHGDIKMCAFDSLRRQMVFATSSGSLLCSSLASADAKVLWTVHLSTDNHLVNDSIVGLGFMMDNEVLVVGSRSGELFSVSLSTLSVEAIGKLEGSIMQMAVSPDGELLAIVAGVGMIVVMTQDWEVLYEVSLDEDSKGSLANGTKQEGSPASSPVQITWRADGKYFATLGGNTLDDGTSELRVWERETGSLHACSRAFPFMCTVVDWIPNGARIATACSHFTAGKPARILFFEKNGLERGFLDINGGPSATVERLQWNCNSELLAVLLRGSEWDVIQVWSFSNYHWYLKQEWRYWKNHHVNFLWDPEKPLCLITWVWSGAMQVIKLCWDSAVTNDSVALVVDGSGLLVTPLSLAQVPPPMSLFKLSFQSPVQAVSLQLGENSSYLAVSLSDGTMGVVEFCDLDNWSTLEDTEIILPSVVIEGQNATCLPLRLLRWVDPKTFVGVPNKQNTFSSSFMSPHDAYSGSEVLVEIEVCEGYINLGDSFSSKQLLKCNRVTSMNKRVLAIEKNPLGNGLLVHMEDGMTHSYMPKRGLYMDEPGELEASLCPSLWIQALSAPHLKHAVLAALDESGKLHVGTHAVCGDCTSFSVHNAYIKGKKVINILYTTKQDVLHVLNLEEILGIRDLTGVLPDLQKSTDKQGDASRKEAKVDTLKTRTLWEKGARLVAAFGGSGVSVILQTARGNLETVYPRSLVLGSIAAALCQGDFYDAVLLARQHHVNLNLIVDFRGWETFLLFATEFILQVKNLNYVTELISAVSAGKASDVTYNDFTLPFIRKIIGLDCEVATSQTSDPQAQKVAQGMKVRSVLQAIRNAVDGAVAESPKKELCILTAMARSEPPELEEALCRIKKLREQEMESLVEELDSGKMSGRLSAEEALKHLLWLSDHESVFNAALGLYDLHLAAMVASNSQGDPKEFLPFLQQLEEMPTSVMKYTIDHRLGRFESALRNLALAGNMYFDECLDLIKRNPTLFPLGKHLFKEGNMGTAVLEAWGDHLLTEEKFEDAAAAFCSCSLLSKALAAYRSGGHWQSVLVVAGMLGFSHAEVTELADELREELQALGRPGDAAKVALEYCKDTEAAIHLFIEAREWNEAVRSAYSCEKSQLVNDQILPAALECASSYIVDFEERIEKLGKYLARFHAVRQRRVLLDKKLSLDNLEGIEDDAASDISSHVSGMSAYTSGSRSSIASTAVSKKSRGKTRGGKIRAGSPGEEAALVEHLKGMELTVGTTEELKKLLHVLVLLGHNSVAEKLQRSTLHFQSTQQRAILEAQGHTQTVQLENNWCFEVLTALRVA